MGGNAAEFVVTAGPTREYLDPVRFLSNPSTGRMGFAVAQAAAKRGCRVTLVAGPVSLPTPAGVKRVDVTSAREMEKRAVEAVSAAKGKCVFVATAAVADWRPARCAAAKLKKGASRSMTLRLVRNPDILKSLSRRRGKGAFRARLRLVGFAAETGDPSKEAMRKLREKGLDFIVANDVSEPGCGFAASTNRAAFFMRDGSRIDMPMMSKLELGRRIVSKALEEDRR